MTARKGAAQPARDLPPPKAPRPQGKLIWLALDDAAHSASARILAQNLLAEGVGVCLLTGFDGDALPDCVQTAGPFETRSDVADFLDYWAPQVIIFIGSLLAPEMIEQARARAIPMLMVQAALPRLPRAGGWLFSGLFGGGLLRQSARAFHAIMAVDENAARAFKKLGAANVMRTGRMEAGSLALPHNEPERAALASSFATRPVWLAIDVPPEEEAAVIAAHRHALRLSHRLLLILVPQSPARAAELTQQIEASEGWIVAQRDLDDELDQETAVYIADTGQEYGLWYRLAPVTFLGGSLFGSGSARSPLEPAALGSAIIHGRKVGAFGLAFGRLGAALGGAPISSSAELADTLTELLAPDRVARIAHAAWTVATEGADVTKTIVETALHLAKE